MKDVAQHGWKEVSLGEICKKTETVDPRKAPADEFDYVDVSSVSNETFTIGETQRLLGADAPSRARRKIRSGDILFATIRPTLQRIAQVPEHLDGQVCSTGYIVLRPRPALGARFLMHSLFHPDFMGAMESLQSGASYPAVTDKQVRAQTIPLPPLEEQQRIVAVLDEAFEGLARARAHAEANLQNAQEVFRRSATNLLSSRANEHEMVELQSVANLDRGHNPPKKDFIYEPREGYVRFYQIRDRKSDDYKVYVPETKKLHKVAPDEILMSAYRHIGEVFRGADGAFNVALCKLSSRSEDRLLNDYLYSIIPTDFVKGELLRHSERSLIPSMSIKHLQTIKIPLPSIAEQKKIVDSLADLTEKFGNLEADYTAKLQDLDDLRQSLLQKAFAGELT